MKKLFAALIACAMALSLVACSEGTSSSGGTSTGGSSGGTSTGGSSTAGGDEAFVFDGPITVVVPFNAGSATDNQLRLMQADLEEALGTNLVIVNSAGGSGTIGTTDFLNSYQPDGYTILYSLATPVVYKPLGGDTAYTYDDLKGVALTSSQPMYLILADTSPFQSAQEVLDYIAANPGDFTYANVGNGGNGHLAFASFLMGEGLEATSVPYTGGTADCYTAMMGGEVDASVYGEADLLARPDAEVLALIGSGAQARSHLLAIREIRKLREVRVWSPSLESDTRFAREMGELTGLPVRICASAKEAAEGADILCTLTPSKTPVLEREWLKPGAHVNAVGACSADARELTGELVRDSVFYCDSVESVMAESGDFLIPLREGLFGEEHLRGTLGELLLGRKPGRTSPEEITVYESLGLAVEDIACAEALCRPAAKL